MIDDITSIRDRVDIQVVLVSLDHAFNFSGRPHFLYEGFGVCGYKICPTEMKFFYVAVGGIFPQKKFVLNCEPVNLHICNILTENKHFRFHLHYTQTVWFSRSHGENNEIGNPRHQSFFGRYGPPS